MFLLGYYSRVLLIHKLHNVILNLFFITFSHLIHGSDDNICKFKKKTTLLFHLVKKKIKQTYVLPTLMQATTSLKCLNTVSVLFNYFYNWPFREMIKIGHPFPHLPGCVTINSSSSVIGSHNNVAKLVNRTPSMSSYTTIRNKHWHILQEIKFIFVWLTCNEVLLWNWWHKQPRFYMDLVNTIPKLENEKKNRTNEINSYSIINIHKIKTAFL